MLQLRRLSRKIPTTNQSCGKRVVVVFNRNATTSTTSPYAILKLKTSASISDIKKNFRQLAKEHHPDLNPHIPSHIAQTKMAEIINAYNQLMDDDFYGRVGDGRVALACELYTLNELKMDRTHDVYKIRVNYEVDGESNDSTGLSFSSSHDRDVSKEKSIITEKKEFISNEYVIEINAHPEDSISDLKRNLQSRYLEEWGLEGRRLDRDQLSTGWEIVCRDRYSEDENDQDAIEVMSYHLFLHSYGILHGDTIWAVVRKYI